MEKNTRKTPKTQINAPYFSLLRPINDRLSTTNTRLNRDRHEIMAEILELARDGRTKTQIMYKANLSYAQSKEYLSILLERGFLETYMIIRHRKARIVLKTSETGKNFIRNFRSLNV